MLRKNRRYKPKNKLHQIPEEEGDDQYEDEENPESSRSTDISALQQYDPNFKRNLGSNCVFLFTNKYEPYLSLGPHWPLFICTFVAFTLASYFAINYLQYKLDYQYMIITLIVCLTQNLSYLATALRNPGIISAHGPIQNLENVRKLKQFCSKCQIIKDVETVHCSSCDVCIEGYDHHCPWTGKCIGKNNLIPFYVFVSTTFIFMIYVIMAVVLSTRLRDFANYMKDFYLEKLLI